MKICINAKKIHISQLLAGYKFHHSDERNLCGLFIWTVIKKVGTRLLHMVSIPQHYHHRHENLKAHILLMVTVYWCY
jgi:hypothetical protein